MCCSCTESARCTVCVVNWTLYEAIEYFLNKDYDDDGDDDDDDDDGDKAIHELYYAAGSDVTAAAKSHNALFELRARHKDTEQEGNS